MHFGDAFILRGIVVGMFQENCWIIGDQQSREAICIDPGDQPDEIVALARDLGVTIKVIANSHAHFDHVLGVRGVQAATGASFLLHEGDLQLLRRGWQGVAEQFGMNVLEGPPDPDAFVADGDEVSVGGLSLKVIATPGHTPGSVSYYVNGLVFSGDTLFRESIGRTDLPGGDHGQEMASICEKLLALPDETVVLPGHMRETTIGFEREHNPFIEDWLAQRS